MKANKLHASRHQCANVRNLAHIDENPKNLLTALPVPSSQVWRKHLFPRHFPPAAHFCDSRMPKWRCIMNDRSLRARTLPTL